MSAEVDAAISNAINVEVKSRYGEEVFAKHTIVLTLCETPREEKDKPDTPRFQVMIKTLEPIQPMTAARILQEAALQFQRQKLVIDEQEQRNK